MSGIHKRGLLLAASLITCSLSPLLAQVVSLQPGSLPQPAPRRIEAAALAPTGPLVTIGDGVRSSGMYTGTDQAPFVAALAALPDGGSVLVGAGTYTFTAPVVVSTGRIALSGPAATLVSSVDPAVGLFDVQADDVSIDGFTLRQDADVGDDHAVVGIAGSRVRLRDCTFTGVAAEGSPTFLALAPGQRDRWIEDNIFQPAAGWTCVRAEGSRGLRLSGNHVAGEGGAADMAYGFELVSEIWSDITGNTFLGLGSVAQPVEAVISIQNPYGEGHHSVISNNLLHLIVAKRGVHLAGVQFSTFSGNALGRMVGSQLQAMLDIDSGPQGVDAQSLAVTGNEFHNAEASAMIRINGIVGVNVSGNQFGLVGATAIVIGDEEAADQVTIANNGFHATQGIGAVPAVIAEGGTAHVIVGNTFVGFPLGGVEMHYIQMSDYVMDLNHEQ